MSLACEVDALIGDAIERRVFPGAVVLIAAGDAILHWAAYGATMYDPPHARTVRSDTIYDIASLTKVFTATAALRLIDDHALDLDAPVKQYLPALRASHITIRHLLTHTSGLDIRLSALRHLGRGDLLAAVYAAEPTRTPGTAVAYTNVNSLLLGEVVAQRYGAPLDAALDALVIRPLGLQHTRFCPPGTLRERIAPTEVDEEWRGGLVHGSVHDESTHALGGVAGHAGLFSTAADLYVFCRMWLGGAEQMPGGWQPAELLTAAAALPSPIAPVRASLLCTATLALARANHTPALHLACGLGWMLDRPNFMGRAPAGSFGHTGFTGPAIVIIPDRHLIVIVLNNRVYPRRSPPAHHAVIAAIVEAALRYSV